MDEKADQDLSRKLLLATTTLKLTDIALQMIVKAMRESADVMPEDSFGQALTRLLNQVHKVAYQAQHASNWTLNELNVSHENIVD